MSFIDHFNTLHEHIKGYTYFSFFIKKELGSEEVIGINAASPSLVRKDSVLERISNTIEKLNLPLKVQEENDKTKYFKILNK